MPLGRTVLVLLLAASLGPAAPPVAVPPGLPKYDLRLTLDTDAHRVELKQRTTWTNTTDRPTSELVFNFYPHFRVQSEDRLLLAKTLELFRLSPSDAIDANGRHGKVNEIALVREGEPAKPLRWSYREDNSSALVVDLTQEVGPGQTVTVDLDCTVRLPNKQGRWGHWRGVHFLTNSLPTLGFYDQSGWHAMPFVPWHQPFWNEAGEYTARVVQAKGQKLACSAAIRSERSVEGGLTEVTTEPFVGRDFALLWSADFEEFTSAVAMPGGQTVTLRCLAFPQHAFYAKEMLRIVGDALPVYAKWFGPYPYDHFTIVESYFGWNGNECAGLVMIDERVFDMPKIGVGYVEYLVSHETCHQWWYNLVGTNGYAETFMDEGPATYFAHRLLDQRRGKNNPMLAWPEALSFAPNIRRENYRFASLAGAIRRDEVPPAAGPLPEFGNIHGLFSGAYDRGSKVYGMIESRLGEAAFFDFIRGLVKTYSFKSLSAVALKRELETYTGKNWDDLFEKWVYSNGLTDWAIERVEIDGERARRFGPLLPGRRRPDGGTHTVEVILAQRREYDEPTTLGLRFAGEDGFSLRVPVGPTTATIKLADHDVTVEPLGGGRCRVRLTVPERPVEIVVDPDRVLLDADPADNVWPRRPRFTLTPLYNLATETSLTADYDRLNVNAGLWIYGPAYQDPWFTRSFMAGPRLGAYRPDVVQGGIYSAFRLDYRDLVVGADGLFDHLPFPKAQVGFSIERRIAGPFYNLNGTAGDGGATRATVFGRYVLRQSSSLYLHPMHYVEGYSAYSDNFLPTARDRDPAGVRPDRSWLNGIHHRLNLYTPYWDPETGAWVDLNYAIGTTRLDGKDVLANQFRAELAAARKLPDGFGYLSTVKVAARGVIQTGWPGRGEYFALGGSTLFRGFDLAERQGSFLWVANGEARLPVFRDRRWNFLDNTSGIRNVSVAGFYDVGGVYANGRAVTNVAHAVGGGLRVDLAVFSFIERATVRFDVAKTVNAGSPVQFWYGLQHPF